ncbi:hypothetical protein DL95DRAFT_402297 [Leptodontidium sp. 2 PMI_412]|nr:hypothetical protein DL95DRAFT_402297 [Leptodontidium sp. 2 PMI_412]
MRSSRSRYPSPTPTESTIRPSRSKPSKPSGSDRSPITERERRRLRQELADEGRSINEIDEMMDGLSLSDSATSRNSSPAPTIRGRLRSRSRHSSPPRRRSPSPYIDTRPPVDKMSRNMLRQELLSEGRMAAWVDMWLKKDAGPPDMGLPPSSKAGNSSRKKIQDPPPGSLPLGLLWSKDPMKDRFEVRQYLLLIGYTLHATNIFLKEQFGPETADDTSLAAKAKYKSSESRRRYSGNLVATRERWRQEIHESQFLEQSERAIRLLLDETFGPESAASRAARKPGPDWLRIFTILRLRDGCSPDDTGSRSNALTLSSSPSSQNYSTASRYSPAYSAASSSRDRSRSRSRDRRRRRRSRSPRGQFSRSASSGLVQVYYNPQLGQVWDGRQIIAVPPNLSGPVLGIWLFGVTGPSTFMGYRLDSRDGNIISEYS